MRIISFINESLNEWRILSKRHKNFNYKYLLGLETIDNLLVLVNFGVESHTKTSHLLATLVIMSHYSFHVQLIKCELIQIDPELFLHLYKLLHNGMYGIVVF